MRTAAHKLTPVDIPTLFHYHSSSTKSMKTHEEEAQAAPDATFSGFALARLSSPYRC
jgi:hypothetical protein